jgi:hypothetical protein
MFCFNVLFLNELLSIGVEHIMQGACCCHFSFSPPLPLKRKKLVVIQVLISATYLIMPAFITGGSEISELERALRIAII